MASSRVLVVGSGAIGLRTAIELLRRNVSVCLRSPRSPLDPFSSCSVGAGGLWMPYHCDDTRTDRWSLETLQELIPMAKDTTDDRVEIVPTVMLLRNNSGPGVADFLAASHSNDKGRSIFPEWTSDPVLDFQHMSVEMLSWQNTVYQLRIPPEQELKEAGYLYAWFFHPPIVNSPRMLESMLQEVDDLGADVNIQTGVEYKSLDDMATTAKELGCDAVVNCTGMGAKRICNDPEMVAGRGILLQFDRSSVVWRESVLREGMAGKKDAVVLVDEAPWASATEPCYMIPRGNLLCVGGSYLEGDETGNVRPAERDRLFQNAHHLGIDITRSFPIGEWTGFRPYRPKVRCEEDQRRSDGVRIIHNYGHGGSGWTVNVGAAKQVAEILLGNSKGI